MISVTDNNLKFTKRFLSFNKDHYIFLSIVCVFLLLRCLFLGSDFFWADNISQLSGGFNKISWGDVLATVVKETLASTNPFLSMLMYRVVLNIFGPDILILQLPTVCVSFLSLYVLHLSLSKLFSKPGPRYLPQILFALSVPSIIYSRQIHQTIFYFFSTSVQIYLFIAMIQDLKPNSPLTKIYRKIQVFTRVSVLMLLVNWMSVLIYVILIGSYVTVVFIKSLSQTRLVRRMFLVIAEVFLEAVPLGILAFLRYRIGDAIRPYLTAYYIDNFWDLPKLSYDLVSYHFNFAYTPNLYIPLGANLVTLPFVILFLAGVIYFLLKCKWHVWPFILAGFISFTAFYLRTMPLGGVRHSFTFAPLLFIFTGYGIEALYRILSRFTLSVSIAKTCITAFIFVAALTFLCSGTNLYIARKQRIDLSTLVKFAEEYNVDTIAGYMETYDILTLMNYNDGNILDKHGIHLELLGEIPYYNSTVMPMTSFDEGKSYLIVAYRTPLDLQFENKKTTTLLEDVDLSLLEGFDLTLQSIYFPPNGFLVYLLEDNVP